MAGLDEGKSTGKPMRRPQSYGNADYSDMANAGIGLDDTRTFSDRARCDIT